MSSLLSSTASTTTSSSTTSLHRLRFEVFGKVQGVFFRKHTHSTATLLSLSGYCKNTSTGTVVGEAYGKDHQSIGELLKWLQTKGSPKSKITKVEFTQDVVEIEQKEFEENKKLSKFEIEKD